MRAFLILLVSFVLAAPASAQLNDWTRAVNAAPDGAFVMGNPQAATRLTEYISYTCPHCGHFTREGAAPLKAGWVKRGLVSVEIRNAVRDPYDLTAALLARCGGKAHFFAYHEALFANQDAWMERVQAFEAKRTPDAKMTPAALLAAIAEGTGLTPFMTKLGLPPARQHLCLSSAAMLKQVTDMTNDAWSVKKINGTPTFAINGNIIQDAHDWASLRAALPALPN